HTRDVLGRFLRTLIAMVIGVVLGAGVLLGVSTPSLAAPASRPAPARAMWIWQAAAVDYVVGWATAHGVRDLFVGFPGGTADLSWFRALRTRADRAGLTMAALGGDPAWATDPAAATR